jgi:hypothetical protein
MKELVEHRLGATLRFVDAFTGQPVGVPLDVRAETLPIVPAMPSVPWQAAPGRNDGTHRLFVTNETVMPVGSIQVVVSDPTEKYVSFEDVSVTLPLPLTAHPPTPARSDFLLEHMLWPTRSFKVPAGETAIVATVQSAGVTPIERLKVKVWPGTGPPPSSPYGYTNSAGELVFRLPDLKLLTGGVITPAATVSLEIRTPPAYVASVIPTQIRNDAGVLLPLPFPLRVGQVTTLQISIP